MTETNFPAPSYQPLDIEALRTLEAIDPNLINSLLYGLAKHHDLDTVDNIIAAGLLGEPGAPLSAKVSRSRILVNAVNSPNPESSSFSKHCLDRILTVFGQDQDWLATMFAQASRVVNRPLMAYLHAAGADPHRPVHEPSESGSREKTRYASAAVQAMRAKLPLDEQTSSMFIAQGQVHLTPGELSPENRSPLPGTTFLDHALAAGQMEWAAAIVDNLAPGPENLRVMGESLLRASESRDSQVGAGLLCLGVQPPDGEAGWQKINSLRKIRNSDPGSFAAQIIFDLKKKADVQHQGRPIAEHAIEVLLAKGLDPNLTDRLGRTLLTSAVAAGSAAIVSALLHAGAIDHTEKGENTLEELAEICGHPHLIPLLQSWKAREAIGKVLREQSAPTVP